MMSTPHNDAQRARATDPRARASMVRPSLLAAFAALLVAACGDTTVADVKGEASNLVAPERIAELLPPEARAVVASYEQDLRGAAEAYKAEFGQLPASFADVASVAAARSAAVTLIADGLDGQIPFASRATLEDAANGVVSAAERQILDRMKTQDAAKQ